MVRAAKRHATWAVRLAQWCADQALIQPKTVQAALSSRYKAEAQCNFNIWCYDCATTYSAGSVVPEIVFSWQGAEPDLQDVLWRIELHEENCHTKNGERG